MRVCLRCGDLESRWAVTFTRSGIPIYHAPKRHWSNPFKPRKTNDKPLAGGNIVVGS